VEKYQLPFVNFTKQTKKKDLKCNLIICDNISKQDSLQRWSQHKEI